MVQANRIQARAFEIDPDFVDEFDYTEFDKRQTNKSAYLYNNNGEWKYTTNPVSRYIGAPVMSVPTTKQICEEINSGRFPI